MKKYLLKEYKVKGGEPEISELTEQEVFELLQERETTRKFVIYEIGACLIDWS